MPTTMHAPAARPVRQVRIHRTVSERFLIGFVAFQGLTGLIGGAMMVAGVNLPPDAWLDGIPFSSWFWPGMILGVGLGVAPLIIAYGLVTRPEVSWLAALEQRADHHWSWVASIGLGIGLIAWIITELFLLPEMSVLQPTYLIVGIGILVAATSPHVHARYRLRD